MAGNLPARFHLVNLGSWDAMSMNLKLKELSRTTYCYLKNPSAGEYWG